MWLLVTVCCLFFTELISGIPYFGNEVPFTYQVLFSVSNPPVVRTNDKHFEFQWLWLSSLWILFNRPTCGVWVSYFMHFYVVFYPLTMIILTICIKLFRWVSILRNCVSQYNVYHLVDRISVKWTEIYIVSTLNKIVPRPLTKVLFSGSVLCHSDRSDQL